MYPEFSLLKKMSCFFFIKRQIARVHFLFIFHGCLIGIYLCFFICRPKAKKAKTSPVLAKKGKTETSAKKYCIVRLNLLIIWSVFFVYTLLPNCFYVPGPELQLANPKLHPSLRVNRRIVIKQITNQRMKP